LPANRRGKKRFSVTKVKQHHRNQENYQISFFEKVRDRYGSAALRGFGSRILIVSVACNGVIYLLRPNQGYGSRASQSEEANKVKDPVIP
jgi:hypothetical protein